jgi:hypothetical protein
LTPAGILAVNAETPTAALGWMGLVLFGFQIWINNVQTLPSDFFPRSAIASVAGLGGTAAGPWKTGHRLLVAVSASPFSEPLIRWTRRMADSLRCPWLAVHVESSRELGDEAQARLEKNLALARTLGAEVIATTDEDLVHGLLRIANQQNISQIIVGKPSASNWLEWLRAGKLLRRLTRESGNIDLHVVRAEKGESTQKQPRWRLPTRTGWTCGGKESDPILHRVPRGAFPCPLSFGPGSGNESREDSRVLVLRFHDHAAAFKGFEVAR